MKHERELVIDFFPEGEERVWTRVTTKEEIDELYQSVLFKEQPPFLLLDCRDLSNQTHLLKFLEEYKGGIKLLTKEPVPGTIISRFQDIEKIPLINKAVFLESFFVRNARASIREKVFNLFFGALNE